jgi:hypothetical protein
MVSFASVFFFFSVCSFCVCGYPQIAVTTQCDVKMVLSQKEANVQMMLEITIFGAMLCLAGTGYH